MVRAPGCCRSQRFRVWWRRSILPWAWGWPGLPFFWRMPRYASRCSRLLRPPTSLVVYTVPLSVSVAAGQPCASPAVVKVATTSSPSTRRNTVHERRQREWSSSQFAISTSLPSARRQWVKSACQTSLGAAASKRIHELRGRLCGSGTTRPAPWKIRRMVETDGTGRPSCPRCQAMVTGPASSPRAVSPVRSAMIRSRTSSWTACGLVRGRLDRGLQPSAPSSRYRARRRWRWPRDRWHSAAAAVTDSCPETTLRTATRCFDMAGTVTHVPTHVCPIRRHLCPELRHLRARHLPGVPALVGVTNGPSDGNCAIGCVAAKRAIGCVVRPP
jgi:hypothetical protein